MTRGLLALAAGIVVAWAVSSCGSGGSGTTADQARTGVTGATAQVPTATAPERERTTTVETPTVTGPARTVTETETVTEPARTVTQPGRTVTQTETTTQSSTVGAIAVVPTATTASETRDDDPFPWWGMVLILLAIGGAIYGIFQLGRRHAQPVEPAAPAPGGREAAPPAPPARPAP